MIKDAFELHYCLNISDIDEEHWKLLESVTEINHLINAGCQKEEARKKILVLREGLIKHFEHEEKVMELSKFPYLQAHRDDHKRGVYALDKIYNSHHLFGVGGKNFLQEFEHEMMNHLDYMDRQYVEYVKAWIQSENLETIKEL